tara:strand:- start:164 stop:388 length:225 start_codon:yes stop_codon:yes gene_type:complete
MVNLLSALFITWPKLLLYVFEAANKAQEYNQRKKHKAQNEKISKWVKDLYSQDRMRRLQALKDAENNYNEVENG